MAWRCGGHAEPWKKLVAVASIRQTSNEISWEMWKRGTLFRPCQLKAVYVECHGCLFLKCLWHLENYSQSVSPLTSHPGGEDRLDRCTFANNQRAEWCWSQDCIGKHVVVNVQGPFQFHSLYYIYIYVYVYIICVYPIWDSGMCIVHVSNTHPNPAKETPNRIAPQCSVGNAASQWACGSRILAPLCTTRVSHCPDQPRPETCAFVVMGWWVRLPGEWWWNHGHCIGQRPGPTNVQCGMLLSTLHLSLRAFVWILVKGLRLGIEYCWWWDSNKPNNKLK